MNEALALDFRNSHSTQTGVRLGFHDWESVWRPLGSIIGLPGARILAAKAIQIANLQNDGNESNNFWQKIAPLIYRFSSERVVRPSCGHHPTGDLLPDSSNLAYCMNHLQSNNKHLFDKLNRLVNRVFPNIHWVGAPPNGSNLFELRVHTVSETMDRGDLAVPINKVGTGIGNALAMLYVALTSRSQRFILLD